MEGKLIERIVVQPEPDFIREALAFSLEYFEAVSEGKEFFDQPSLSQMEGRYDEDAAILDERYSDLLTYLTSIRRKMPDLWAGKDDMALLFRLNTGEESRNYFIENLFTCITSSTRLAEISLEEFIVAAKFSLIELLQDNLEIMALSQEELSEIYGNYRSTEIDFADIISKVQQLKITDSEKILLLDFFTNISDYYERIIDSLSAVEELCISSYDLVRTLFKEKILDLIEDGGLQRLDEQWLQRLDVEAVDFRRDEDIYLWISIVEYNGLWLNYSQNFEKNLYISLGLIFTEMLDLSKQSDQRQMIDKKQLSALSDSTRYKVVNALAERPHYAQELADKLGITPATLSHHMQILINSLLISVRTEGRRTYYRLKTAEIKRLAHSLLTFAEAVEKGGDA
ncbi:MAG: metalloregulator ArsR/SmtB family transcription factor [Eubacteriales bacterium]|nr:metalloregulator ArsR/SmtB family transcription factor [Eubacteriales bacterium]MDD4323341.1 metalloregulator ArsR/SmtB family transcription factor [Eubacteriales bacterium]